jgi:hypothetical protein
MTPRAATARALRAGCFFLGLFAQGLTASWAVEPVLTVQGSAMVASVGVTVTALERLPSHSYELPVGSGEQAKYRCALLADVLTHVGVPMGGALRGARLAEHVRVRARDGYEVVFAIAELDEQFRATPPMLCYARDGQALVDDEGPLRLIVPDDKKHGRWVRQVERLSWEK